MGLKAGIVGLPNVGKSTIFNALTKSAGKIRQDGKNYLVQDGVLIFFKFNV